MKKDILLREVLEKKSNLEGTINRLVTTQLKLFAEETGIQIVGIHLEIIDVPLLNGTHEFVLGPCHVLMNLD